MAVRETNDGDHASEKYVEQRLAEEIGNKEFTPIDQSSGNFMLPFRKVGNVQQYMRLSLTSIDGVWVPDLDQKVYQKDENGQFVEVNNA